jgi:hypothetical protein
MKMSIEARRGTSVICFYSALLFGLLAFAAKMKMNFHGRGELSTGFLVTAAVLAAFGVVFLLSSLGKKA